MPPGSRSPFRSAVVRVVLPTVLLLALFPAGGCGRISSPPPSLALVTLDTTRRDALGTYGNPAARTPFFDAVARRGALCRDAVADGATTLPSHAGMLAGQVSLRHGVRRNGRSRLDTGVETVAEWLADHGFDTAAVVSSAVLRAEHGLAQGFARYDDRIEGDYPVFDARWRYRALRLAGNQRRAWETTRATVQMLDEMTAPAFLWVHYIDAHQPVDPPPPWRETPGLTGYAAEVAIVDRAMGRMLRHARERLGPLVVAILADHGEELGERGYTGHALFLHESVVRIPFALEAPGLAPILVSEAVRNYDVAPVLATLAKVPREFADGRDFLSSALPPDFTFAETLEPTETYGGAAARSLRTTSLKVIASPQGELYDLRADPGETRNLWDERPRERDRMAEMLEAYVAAVPATDGAELVLDEEKMESLRALGYAASSAAAPPDDEDGIDAKELIDVVEAVRRVDDGLFDGVEERLDRFRTRHPEPPDARWNALFARAHFCRAALHTVSGDTEAARREARRALELAPDFRDARALLRQLGDE